MITKIDRRTLLQSAGLLAAASAFGSSVRPLFGSSSKPQRFEVGFAPATDGTLDSYWMRMNALAGTGFRNIEVDNGMIKIAESYASKLNEFRDRMSKLNLRLVGVNQPYLFADPAM